jgi:hypothetical protein
MRLTGEDRGFRQGVAIALANLNRMHDAPTMVADVLGDIGLSRAQYRSAGVDPYDLNELSKCVRQGSGNDRSWWA